jgi:putative colanic acid biosynthesis UDP-glucose lipid carrier transferase
VISRHQGLLGNSTQELNIGRAVAAVGEQKVKDVMWFHPKEPNLKLDTAIDGALLSAAILELYNAYRTEIEFTKNDLKEKDDDNASILNLLKTQTVDIQFIPDIHEYATLGCEIEDFDGLPIININHSPLAGWGFLVKRFSDILFSATALILFCPVFIILAILIKWSSQGSIFYKQERMGLDGVTFYMLKFRSMHENAEKASGAVWASAQDSRRTRLGAFLRRTSLDELPQFWNVLVGNMSLVGPRPERPIFIKKFKEEIPHYMLRHKVKAGMTGWAQVSGWRGNTSLDKRIECDLYYIRNWSFLFDLKILILTFWKGFMNKNAY